MLKRLFYTFFDYDIVGEYYESCFDKEKQINVIQKKYIRNSWTYTVDESNGEATIGSPLENAIWEEFGTGQYALNGDGRKTPWVYKDDKGNWHRTTGKQPRRALNNAYITLKSSLQARLEQVLKGL